MQESPEHPLGLAHKLVAGLEKKYLQDLCSEVSEKRGNAVNTILARLKQAKNPRQDDILQTLPIALIESREYIGTIYFIEHCIRNGAFFDPKIIDTVINTIVAKKIECIDNEENEAANVITQILHRFYNTILAHSEYQKEPEIYLSIGTNVEQEKDVPTAINLYNEAIGLGSMDGYYCAACAYESQGNYDMSATIFDAAYQICGEERFLHRYIHALCKAGKREEAYTYYLYLQSKNKNVVDGYQEASKTIINPFIVYSEVIHSDDDLREFELLMTAYLIEGNFKPNENLREIATNASVYIGNEIEKESMTIQNLNLVPNETWTDEQDTIYWQSLKRRLYLMQMHIINIQNPRYMEFYFQEMRSYTIEGNAKTQHMMRDFFADSFSEYVFASCNEITQNTEFAGNNMKLIESIRVHLVQIRTMYSQSSYYDITRDTITPFIEECLKLEGEFDDSSSTELPQFSYGFTPFHHGEDGEDGEEISGSAEDLGSDIKDLKSLKRENKNYEMMTESTRKMYEKYIEYIDNKYGMFYRRNLQQLTRDEMSVPSGLGGEFERELEQNGGDETLARNTVVSNMQVFLDYPDIALFFFLEKILLGQNYLEEDQDMESFLMKYHFDGLILPDVLLFASILYENGEQYDASEYIANIQGMLNMPKALYMLMESIRYMDTEDNPGAFIKSLDKTCKIKYKTKGFFEYLTILAQKVIKSPKSDDDKIGYMLLAIANMKCFQGGDPKEIIEEFEAAGDRGIVEGYISAGDILEETGDHIRAIEYFHKAHLLSPTIVTIRRILNILLLDKRFDEAWEYINDAIRNEYDVAGYISTWYLYQGKNKEAMEELCKIIQSSGLIDIVFPEAYTDSITKAVETELNSPDLSIDQSQLMILASYIKASFTAEEGGSDPADYIKHVEYIEWLVNTYSKSQSSEALLRSIPILTGDINLHKNIPTLDQSSGYLHLHLVKIHAILVRYHKANCIKKDSEAAEKTFKFLNSLSIAAKKMLKKFPNTEKYLPIWEKATNLVPTKHDINQTVHEMPETVQ